MFKSNEKRVIRGGGRSSFYSSNSFFSPSKNSHVRHKLES